MDKNPILLLLTICLLLYFWGLGSKPFADRGEPRESLVVSEMYTSGNWILPLVNGDYIPFKPPLMHWIGLLAAFGLGGVNEFTTRFPSALCATLGVLLIYFTGRKLWGEKAGLVAAFVLATNTEWWNAATLAQVDMMLVFFVSAALIYFIFIYRRGEVGPYESVAMATLLALATLSKGPVGALLPALVILAYLLARRDLAFLKRIHFFKGALAFILVAGPWYAAAGLQGGKAFFAKQILEESFSTALGNYGHYQSPYYLVGLWFLNMLPWSLFFPSLGWFLYKKRGHLDQENFLFLLVWFATVLIFFSLARGKRGIYLLPLYPAVALIFGAWWQELATSENRVSWYERWVGYVTAAAMILGLATLLAGVVGLEPTGNPIYALWARILAEPIRVIKMLSAGPLLATCFALSGVAALLLIRGASVRSWNTVFIGLGAIALSQGLATERAYYPSVASQRTMKPFAERLSQEVDPETSLLFYRAWDYGVIFYANRHLRQFHGKEKEVLRLPFYLLMWEEQWKELTAKPGLEVVDTSEGTGAVGKHHMVLVKVSDPASVEFKEGQHFQPSRRPRTNLSDAEED
jgi:4-amino-4-deoxy-L-arabinose transferase-like glycosyltransferase